MLVVLISPSVVKAETVNKQSIEQMQAMIIQLTKILNQLVAQLNEKLNKQSTTLTTIQNTQQQQTSQLQQIQQTITPTPVYIPPNLQPKTPIKFTLQSVMSECLNGPSGPNLNEYNTAPASFKIQSNEPVKGKLTFTLSTNNQNAGATLSVSGAGYSNTFQALSGQYSIDDGFFEYGAINISSLKSPTKVMLTIDSFQPEDGRVVEGLPLKFSEVNTKTCN